MVYVVSAVISVITAWLINNRPRIESAPFSTNLKLPDYDLFSLHECAHLMPYSELKNIAENIKTTENISLNNLLLVGKFSKIAEQRLTFEVLFFVIPLLSMSFILRAIFRGQYLPTFLFLGFAFVLSLIMGKFHGKDIWKERDIPQLSVIDFKEQNYLEEWNGCLSAAYSLVSTRLEYLNDLKRRMFEYSLIIGFIYITITYIVITASI